MTQALFVEDPSARACDATVVAIVEGAAILDRTVFYAQGGGQPGDSGVMTTPDGAKLPIVNAKKSEDGAIAHVFAEGVEPPSVGATVDVEIDWTRRHRHMRMHTALHLLCACVEGSVTGGRIGEDKSRLDFDIPSGAVDKVELTARLNAFVAQDAPVRSRWIDEAELDANPDLVRTLSVKPPRGSGRVRLIEIEGVDLQPCGGTHVARTGEIGVVAVSKIENKGRQNRRIAITLS